VHGLIRKIDNAAQSVAESLMLRLNYTKKEGLVGEVTVMTKRFEIGIDLSSQRVNAL
jgi:hypothetical protein